jgi:hypothetical protein
MYSNQKLIISGDTVHYYHYSYNVEYGETNQKNAHYSPRIKKEDEEANKAYSSVFRSKKQVKLLLQSNAYQHTNDTGGVHQPIFLTLTFAENVTGIQEANRQFRNFIQRLNYNVFGQKLSKLKYLVVPEFQERGAVHYHAVFFNLPYLKNIYDRVLEIWGHGFTFVETIKNLKHLTAYVTKYITKGTSDERLNGEKSYFCSKGLIKPIVERREVIINSLFNLMDCNLVYRNTFQKGTEEISYECYSIINLKQNERIQPVPTMPV